MKKIKKTITLEEFKKQNKARMNTAEFKHGYDSAERAYQLAIKVRKLREKAGISQSELALRMGTTQPAIARLEAGGGNPNLDTLDRIASALGHELKVTFRKVG